MKSSLIKSSIAQPIIVVFLLACSLSCNNKNDCTQIVKNGDDTCFSVTYNNISTVLSVLSNKTLLDSARLDAEITARGYDCSFFISDSTAYIYGVIWDKPEKTVKLNAMDKEVLLRILSGVYITHDFNIIINKKPCNRRSDGSGDLKIKVYYKGKEVYDSIRLSPECYGYAVTYSDEFDLFIYIIRKYYTQYGDDLYEQLYNNRECNL